MGKIILKSQRGSIIVTSLILTGLTLVIFLAVGNSISGFDKYQKREISNITVKQALNSAIDYTATAIKQNWCMTPTWAKSIAGTCGLDDKYNLERMLLSDDTIKFLATSGTYVADKLRLYKIGPIKVSLDAIQTEHPLFSMLTETKKFGAKNIIFTVERVQKIQSPARGKEVPLKITVEMDFASYTRNNKIEGYYYFYPREIGTNALVLANDLYLNKNVSTEMDTAGDSRIQFNNSPAASGGLRFESPVFINGNIILPKSGTSDFSNVTFVDKLILGGGIVKVDTEPFYPQSLGGKEDQYNYQIKSFGGFLGGVELDAARDPGLDILSGKLAPPADMTNFELCKQRLAAKMDLTKTRDSQLWIKITENTANSVSGVLNLGKVNSFLPQSIPMDDKDVNLATKFSVSDPMNGSYPILRVWVDTLDYTGSAGVQLQAFASLSRNGSVTISSLENLSTKIDIQVTPYLIGTNVQDNAVNFKITYTDLDKIAMGTADPFAMKPDKPRFIFRFEAFDLGYANGVPTRKKTDTTLSLASTKPSDTAHYLMDKFKLNGIKLAKNGANFNLEKGADFKESDYYSCNNLDKKACDDIGMIYFEEEGGPVANQMHSASKDDQDLAAIDMSCSGLNLSGSDENPSFEPASWDQSFTFFSKKAWSFSGNGSWKVNETVQSEIEKVEITSKREDPKFNVVSYGKECIVKPEANFVTGFFACDKFIIEPRTKPLRIIGSVIANKLIVDDSAIQKGIVWSSIYNSTAVYELRDSKVLNGVDCENKNKPVWLPYPNVGDLKNIYNCNPISLRAKADPFRWSTIDPDCGPVGTSGSISCKGRVSRWVSKEIYRKFL